MRPRIMLLALSDWYGTARLPKALRDAGFDIAVMAEPDSLLAQSSHIDYRFDISVALTRLGVLDPILNAIDAFGPRIVVPCDEASVHLLQNIAMAFEGVRAPDGQFRVMVPPLLRETLLRSLGDVRTFSLRTSRPASRRAAALLGLATPPTAPVPYLQVAEGFARDHGWPVVLIREGDTDGERVRVCADATELRAAYSDLTNERRRPGGIGHLLRKGYWSVRTGLHLAGDLTRVVHEGPLLAIEARAPGRPASYTAVANEGHVVGGLAAVAELPAVAPEAASSVVRLVNDPMITDAARKMIGRMTFTGFCGLDFVRDEAAGKLWFLKFSPRPTALSHLGALAGGDLCTMLMQSLTNSPVMPQARFRETTVALFPQDWMRDPNAADRHAEHLDLPQDDERLMHALQRLVPRAAAA